MFKLNSLSLVLALASAAGVPTLAHAAPTVPKTAPRAAPAASAAIVSAPFRGAEVNGGTVSLVRENGRSVLRLSSDFKIPKAPAPHWQIVDGSGNVYLLARLTVVGDKTHREIVLPKYVASVAKVQIWCAFAEVLLGETSFGKTIPLGSSAR